MSTSAVFKEALSLPEPERAKLAHELLLSLELEVPDPDADEAWAAEVRRRISAIRSGQTPLIEWDEAIQRMRSALAARGKQ